MYEFHCKYIKSRYSANLLFTDTDSYEDGYENLYEDKDLFDFIDYPQDSMELRSKFFDPVNKKDTRKMKDEFKGKIISEFVGLKSKMYSLIALDGRKIKRQQELTKMLLKT